MVQESFTAKALNCFLLYSTETFIVYTVQKISKSRTALAEATNLSLLANLVFPCILFDSHKKTFLVLSKREQVFLPLKQWPLLLLGNCAVNNEADVDNKVRNRLNPLNDAL